MLLSNNANNKPIIQKYTLPWHLLKPAFFSTASDRTLYEILGVHRKASQKQLKAAYLKLSMEYHPDKVGDDKIEEAYEEYIRIREAFDTLSDEKLRADYDLDTFPGVVRCGGSEYPYHHEQLRKRKKEPAAEELTEEEKQTMEDEKNAMNLMRSSPVYKMLSYLYGVLVVVGALMWYLGSKGDSGAAAAVDDDSETDAAATAAAAAAVDDDSETVAAVAAVAAVTSCDDSKE